MAMSKAEKIAALDRSIGYAKEEIRDAGAAYLKRLQFEAANLQKMVSVGGDDGTNAIAALATWSGPYEEFKRAVDSARGSIEKYQYARDTLSNIE